MHKVLLLLGLLLRKPLHGYEIHRIVRAHGEIYADLKKANMYYLLERLARDGYLETLVEEEARGARGERVVYSLTDTGRTYFSMLLHEIMLNYETVHTGIDTAVVFLSYLSPTEALALLERRQSIVTQRREQVIAEQGDLTTSGPLVRIASNHIVALIDAELSWMEQSLAYLRNIGWTKQSTGGCPQTHSTDTTIADNKE